MATLATGLLASFGRTGLAPVGFLQVVSPISLRFLHFHAFPSAIGFPSQTDLRQNLKALRSNMTRTSRIVALLTSVWLIAASALGARLGFAWDQQRTIPHQVLATVPFDQEAGNTAL